MASKPTIYGFDDAGCKWEIVHKEDVPVIKKVTPTINYNISGQILTMTFSGSELNNLKSGDLVIMNIFEYHNLSSDSSTVTLSYLQIQCDILDSIVFGIVNLRQSDGTKYMATNFPMNDIGRFSVTGSFTRIDSSFVIIGVVK